MEEMEKLYLYHMSNRLAGSKPIMCTLQIEDQPLQMEVDTDADVHISYLHSYQTGVLFIDPSSETAINLSVHGCGMVA